MNSLRSTVQDLAVVVITFALLLLLVFPFLWVVLTSIRPESELFSTDFRLLSSTITFENYRKLINSDFMIYIRNSLLVSIPSTLIAVAVSYLAAYSFSRREFRYRYGLLLLVVFSQLFPFIILTTPVYIIYARLNLVNTFASLIITYIAISIPFSVYMLLGYLDNIPQELDEASLMDGASTFGTVFRIVLPVAWPGIAATAIYTFILACLERLSLCPYTHHEK